MIEATKWGVKAILTDRTAEYLKLRAQMEGELTFTLLLLGVFARWRPLLSI